MSTITVSTTAALNSALRAAQDGDTIQLAPGTYNGLNANNLSFANGITITSADPAHAAVLTNFDLSNDRGITFSNLEFNAQAPGYYVFNFSNLTNVHFDHLSVHGSMDGNPVGDAEGFAISGSTNVSITNSEFQQLERAVAINTSSNVVFSNNNVHDVVVTGVSFAQVGNVTVNGNMFSNFHPEAGDHPDAIQFLTAGTTAASHDISITNNAIYRGTGDATQGIFFRDQLTTMTYQNVTIANNLIDGTGYGGIAIDSIHNLSVTGNTLVSNPGDTNKTWINISGSDTVSVNNNQAVVIGVTTSTNLTQIGNIINTAVTDGGAAALHDFQATHAVGIQGTTPAVVTPPAAAPVVVNIAPTGADASASIAWNATKVFAAGDFGFADADGNHLAAVKIATLPGVGSLTDNGVAVTAGQAVSAADIAAGKLVYHAPTATAAAHVDIAFKVQDDGGTANGGVDTDATANTYHIDVAAQPAAAFVNHAPSGADSTSSLTWNAAKVFLTSDFGASDTDGNNLSAVKIDTLPSAGSLTNNGVAVTAGQSVSAADIAAGKLVYHAPATAGAAHVDITFQVKDDGGTANGGVDTDPTPNTLHFDIAAQPAATPTTIQQAAAPAAPAATTVIQGSVFNENLSATNTATEVHGGAGNDTITGTSVSDYLRGDDGDDVINGGSAFDDINGNAGNDTAHGNAGDDWVVGGKGDDMLFGDAGNDLVYGNLGNDTLDGGDGNDTIRGGQGNDVLIGGAGNDYLSGDRGDDTLTGGAGADTFHSSQDAGIDKITDFNQAQGDHVLLDAGTTYTLSQVGADTIIDMGGGNEVILSGVQLSSLHDGWLTVG